MWPSLLLFALLNGAVADDCPSDHNYTEFDPPALVVRYGEPVSVRCYSTKLSDLNWTVPVENVIVDQSNVTWSTKSLTDWEIEPQCYGQLADEPCYKALPLTIYKIPDNVSFRIENHTGPLIEENEYELRCDVENVAPVKLLTVKWYQGQILVNNSRFFNLNKTLVNVSATLSIFADMDEDGAQYWCEAVLELGPNGPQTPPKVTSLPISINVYYAPKVLEFQKEVVTTVGSTVNLSCDILGNPEPEVEWLFNDAEISLGPQRILTLSGVTAADSGIYKCTATNELGTQSMVVLLQVKEIPDQVSIRVVNHTGPMLEGIQYELWCDIPNIVHVDFLTVVWYKGQTLLERRLIGDKIKTMVNFSSPLQLSPNRADNGVQLRCEAEIDLGPHGPQNLTVKSDPLSIIVYYSPDFVEFLTENLLAPIGSFVMLPCGVDGNPKPNVIWTFKNQTKTSGVQRSSLELSGVTSSETGLYHCTATNAFGSKTRTVFLNVRGECPITFDPPKLVVEFGALASANCTTTIQHIGIGWEEPQGPVGTMSDLQSISWTEEKLLDWEKRLFCFVKLSTWQQCRRALPLIVYKTPDNVSISVVNHTEVEMVYAKQYELRCDVHNVAPVEFLTVNWYREQTLVGNFRFPRSTKSPVNMLSTLKMSPYKADNHTHYWCEAVLDLGLEGSLSSHSVRSRPLNIIVSDICPLTIHPHELVVEYGSLASAMCSTWASHRGMAWEASQGGTNMELNVQQSIWNVTNVRNWDINPMCYINTLDKQCQQTLAVTLYKIPDVFISIVNNTKTLIEDNLYVLKCHIQDVAPLEVLTVNWYNGQALVSKIKFPGSTKTPTNTFSKLMITPTRDDDGAQYRCEAVLNLGPAGPQSPPTVASDPLILTVLYKPMVPCLNWSPMLKTSLESYPYAVKANPAPDTKQWFQGGSPVSSTVPLNSRDSGQYTYVVSNAMGSAICFINITVEYGPKFNCPPSFSEREYTILQNNCTVMASPVAKVFWFKDGKEVQPPLKLTRKNNGSYTITAQNKHGLKQHVLIINVFYAPEIQLSTNHSRVEVLEGHSISLGCSAVGNPQPQIRWSFQNQSTTTGWQQSTLTIPQATSAHAGTYTCTATNDLGNQYRTVSVELQKGQISLTTIIIVVVVSVCILFLLVFFIWLCCRRQRTGIYSVQSNGARQVDMPLLEQKKLDKVTEK